MKRITMMMFVAVLFVAFTACSGGSKKAEEAADKAPVEEVIVEEVVEVEVPAQPTPAEAVKAFTEFSKEYGEAFNNLAKDPAKFQKLASQVQQKVADMERLKVDFNAKQLKEYEKARELITKVNSGGK